MHKGWFEGSAQASEVALALGEGCNIRFVDYEAEVQPPASSEKRSFARIGAWARGVCTSMAAWAGGLLESLGRARVVQARCQAPCQARESGNTTLLTLVSDRKSGASPARRASTGGGASRRSVGLELPQAPAERGCHVSRRVSCERHMQTETQKRERRGFAIRCRDTLY